VKVDGVLVGDDVSNESAVLHAKVPYVIDGLAPVSHVVQIISHEISSASLRRHASRRFPDLALAQSALSHHPVAQV